MSSLCQDDDQFKEGQKLEAVDPLEMSRICPATIGKVVRTLNPHAHPTRLHLGTEQRLLHALHRRIERRGRLRLVLFSLKFPSYFSDQLLSNKSHSINTATEYVLAL